MTIPDPRQIGCGGWSPPCQPAEEKADDRLARTACSGLDDSLSSLCEYLADKSKEHRLLASFVGYSPTGDAMALHQKEWADTLDSWIAQIQVLTPKCKLCGDLGYYDGGIYDGEPCRVCSQNAPAVATAPKDSD